jgi:hypothetical protein
MEAQQHGRNALRVAGRQHTRDLGRDAVDHERAEGRNRWHPAIEARQVLADQQRGQRDPQGSDDEPTRFHRTALSLVALERAPRSAR